MHFRLSVIILLMLTLLLAGGILTEDKGGNPMAATDQVEAKHSVLPPIDKDVPGVMETATFALG